MVQCVRHFVLPRLKKDAAWQVRIEKRQTHVYAKSYPGDYVRCFVAL